MKSRLVFHLCGSVGVALLLAIGSPLAKAQASDSAEISKLLADAKMHAALAEYDSDTLLTFTNSEIPWEAHAAQIRVISEHVNDLAKVVKQLNEARGHGSPWQQVAIERINPLLRNMADNLNATIKELNDHKDRIQMPEYREYLRANSDLANRTSTVISDFVEYSRAGSRSESLQQKLELPAK
jgi:hypothetical protein